MKELLKNKWAWAVLVLVIINIATIGAIWSSMCGRDKHHMGCHRDEICHHGGHGQHGGECRDGKHRHGEHKGHKGGDFLAQELNLTEEQQSSFEALRKEHFEKMKVNFDSMKALKKEMLQSLGKTDAEANAVIQKIGAMEMVIQKETFDHFNKMYALCTDSQKVQLKDKLGNIMGPHGPGFGGRGGDRSTPDQYEHPGPGGKPCCGMPPKRF